MFLIFGMIFFHKVCLTHTTNKMREHSILINKHFSYSFVTYFSFSSLNLFYKRGNKRSSGAPIGTNKCKIKNNRLILGKWNCAARGAWWHGRWRRSHTAYPSLFWSLFNSRRSRDAWHSWPPVPAPSLPQCPGSLHTRRRVCGLQAVLEDWKVIG